MSEPQLPTIARQLRTLFLELRSILVEEGDMEWINRIEGCLAGLPEDPEALPEPEVRKRLREVSREYREMVQPKGGFSEYFIWRETVEERISANRDLDALRDAIWEIVEEFGFAWVDG